MHKPCVGKDLTRDSSLSSDLLRDRIIGLLSQQTLLLNNNYYYYQQCADIFLHDNNMKESVVSKNFTIVLHIKETLYVVIPIIIALGDGIISF